MGGHACGRFDMNSPDLIYLNMNSVGILSLILRGAESSPECQASGQKNGVLRQLSSRGYSSTSTHACE